MRKLLIAAACLMLSGCGAGIEGTFADGIGATQYRFERGGKVFTRVLGAEVETTYEMDGDKIKLLGPGNVTVELLKKDDDTLVGPLGMALTRKE